jgi:hypothetical protein
MPRRKKSEQHSSVLTVMEMMRLSKRQLRDRAFDKRPSVGRPKTEAPYSETGKLGPDDLRRWKKPEKPIEIIE